MRCEGHVPHMGGMRNAYKILVRKYEGRRPLRRPRDGWENNIGMNLGEIKDVKVWTGCIWVRTGTNGRLLWTQQ